MNSLLEKLYPRLPNFLQELFVTGYDLKQYRLRRSGQYAQWKSHYTNYRQRPLSEITKLQDVELTTFLKHAVANSPFYSKLYSGIDIAEIRTASDLQKLPIVEKEAVRKNLAEMATVKKRDSFIAHTGGTTGKSLEVWFTKLDMQKRWAMLDSFRDQFGYRLGKKTAWFSGKTLLSEKDLADNRFWKTDHYYNIRYYSTFHITHKSIKHYIENLNRFKPLIISGFPTTLYELASLSVQNNAPILFKPEAIFVTAETLIPEQMKVVENVFGSTVYDQYASSEGAPFVIQCKNHKMHYEMLSGIIEIVDNNMQPASEGEILVTSFMTYGTPLIRYRIGDSMTLSRETCTCGNNNPLIGKIEGRVMDYVYSKERGKISLVNISNCVKHVNGIIQFQVLQDTLDEIQVILVRDNALFSQQDEAQFIKELRDRLGDKIGIRVQYQDSISKTPGGKHKFIDNKIAHLLPNDQKNRP